MASIADAKRLVDTLLTDLHQLSNESRKKHPQVKDAAESCLVKVRNISGGKTSDENIILRLRQGSNEILHPFLMGCATRNPKIVQISLGCLQRIISCKALNENSCATVINELWSLMEAECEELRVLQTLTLLITTGNELPRGQTLAKCLVICFRLHFAKDSVVINTASASVRQLVGQVFERVLTEDAANDHENEKPTVASKPNGKVPPASLRPCATDAYMLFQDLCLLVNAEHPVWLLGITEMTRTLGLELLEAVLTNFSSLFSSERSIFQHTEFGFLLKEHVCPLVIKLFSPNLKYVQVSSQHPYSRQENVSSQGTDRPYFPIVMRLLRVVAVLVTLYYDLLVTECEIFLSLLVKFLEGEKLPWQRALALEVLQKITSNPQLLRRICANYDQKPHATKVLQEIVNNLGGYVQNAFIYEEMVTESSSNIETESNSSAVSAQPGFLWKGVWIPLSFIAAQGSPKALFLELLDKHEAPSLPEGYCLSLAYAGLVDATHSIHGVIDADSGNEEASKQLLESTYSGILSSVALLFEASCDENLSLNLLKCMSTFLDLSCRLGQWKIRDACLRSLCKAALPVNYFLWDSERAGAPTESRIRSRSHQSDSNASSSNEPSSAGTGPSNVVAVGTACPTPDMPQYAINTPVMLTTKNLQAVRSLITAAQNAALSLQESWYMVLVTLEHLVWILGLKPGVGGVLKASAKSSDANAGMVVTTAALADVPVLTSMISQLIQLTKNLSDVGVHHVIAGLCKMSTGSMEVAGSGREPSFFPIVQLMQTGLVNLHRIETCWNALNGHFIEVCNHSYQKLREWGARAIVSLVVPAFSSAQSSTLDSTKIQHLIFSPIMDMSEVPHEDVRGIQLNCLMQILQSEGQKIDPTLWPKIIHVIGRAAQSENSSGEANIKQGYQAVHLLTTDFLPSLSMDCVKQLIEVVTKFGAQKQELNISLSAVGQLWTLSDYLFRKRTDISPEILDDVWLSLYQCLSELCINERPPVRKSACQTLLQTVASHGSVLQALTWHQIIWKVLFPLIRDVVRLTESASTVKAEPEKKGNPGILIHHSRDTESKQWAETYVQTLSGVVRIFNAQIKAMYLLEDFSKAWESLLDFISSAATSFSPEISLAALKSFQELLQGRTIAPSNESKPGSIQSSERKSTEASSHVNTAQFFTPPMWLNAWQTWLMIGEAMTSLRMKERDLTQPASVIVEEPGAKRPGRLLPLPSPNHLTTLLNTFPLLFDRTKQILDVSDIPRWIMVLRGVTSLPISTEQAPFLLPTAADLTPSQEAVLNCAKVVYTEVSKSGSPLRPTLPSLFTMLLGFVEYACKAPEPLFMDKKTSTNNNGGCADWVVQNYVPFGELCLRTVVEYFAETAHFSEVVEAQVITQFVKTVKIPLTLKYSCPAQSTWKLAASSLLSVMGLGLPIARQNLQHCGALWLQISTVLESFLFPKSEPPPNLSSEERKRQEFIDCQFIDLIRAEVLPFTSVLPRDFVQKIIEILNRGSISLADPKDLLGLTSMHKQRGELSRACFDALLAMSQGEPDLVKCTSPGGGASGTSGQDDMGGEAVSSLLSRCKTVISAFVEEERSTGGLPLPQQKVGEMISVLNAVITLMDSLRKRARLNPSEHERIWERIIDLYPDLVGCIHVHNSEVKSLLLDTLNAYRDLLQPPRI